MVYMLFSAPIHFYVPVVCKVTTNKIRTGPKSNCEELKWEMSNVVVGDRLCVRSEKWPERARTDLFTFPTRSPSATTLQTLEITLFMSDRHVYTHTHTHKDMHPTSS